MLSVLFLPSHQKIPFGYSSPRRRTDPTPAEDFRSVFAFLVRLVHVMECLVLREESKKVSITSHKIQETCREHEGNPFLCLFVGFGSSLFCASPARQPCHDNNDDATECREETRCGRRKRHGRTTFHGRNVGYLS